MTVLGKSDKSTIFSSHKREYENVAVPEWGHDAEVRIQSLTGKERDKWETGLSDRKGRPTTDNYRGKLVAVCAVDEAGDLLFTNSHEVDRLGELSAKALQRVFKVCQSINGMTEEEAEEDEGDFDEPTPVELSTSVSPPISD